MSKELLFSVTKKDLTIQTFKSGGKGGQHQNKTDSGVRIIHKDSGAVGESREERSQYLNKKLAFRKLTKDPKFKIWLNQKTYEVINKTTIEKEVKKAMSPENLCVEYKSEEGWVEVKEEKDG